MDDGTCRTAEALDRLGKIVVEKLAKTVPSGEVIALVRDLIKAGDIGVATRVADYSRAETLDAALAGVEKLLLISGSEVGSRAQQHGNVIDAAKATPENDQTASIPREGPTPARSVRHCLELLQESPPVQRVRTLTPERRQYATFY